MALSKFSIGDKIVAMMDAPGLVYQVKKGDIVTVTDRFIVGGFEFVWMDLNDPLCAPHYFVGEDSDFDLHVGSTLMVTSPSRYATVTLPQGSIFGIDPSEYGEFCNPSKQMELITCECGSDKAEQPGHSGWCPKFKQ